jgi:hypothetical protein
MAATFNKLVDAQKCARDNHLDRYWRLIFVDNNKIHAGGWLAETYPRERFYMDREQCITDAVTQIKGNHRIDVSTMWTDQTSDSPNAR